MEQQNHLSPSGLVWRGEVVTAPGCCSVGFHHKFFQRPLPLIPTKQKNFFDFILLEAHIIKLSQQMQEFSCLEEEGRERSDVIMDGCIVGLQQKQYCGTRLQPDLAGLYHHDSRSRAHISLVALKLK